MPTDTLLRSVFRGWYVVAIGVIATVGGMVRLTTEEPLFYARSEITFSGVTHAEVDSFASSLQSSVGEGTAVNQPFVSAVESVVNDGRPVVRLASPDAPLHGTGIREGYFVAMPDTGGQSTYMPSDQSPLSSTLAL